MRRLKFVGSAERAEMGLYLTNGLFPLLQFFSPFRLGSNAQVENGLTVAARIAHRFADSHRLDLHF
jgi:hypothetical protein